MMRQRINIRERFPIWGLRLVLGLVLLIFSELVMRQNPLSRSPMEWVALYVLYVAHAAILMDMAVRFQANEPASLLMVSGVYGLINSAVISYVALENPPISLAV